jgi:hypothetical protein
VGSPSCTARRLLPLQRHGRTGPALHGFPGEVGKPLGLLAPNFDGIDGDPHDSLTQRLGVIVNNLQLTCPTIDSYCAEYRYAFHPCFPVGVPM